MIYDTGGLQLDLNNLLLTLKIKKTDKELIDLSIEKISEYKNPLVCLSGGYDSQFACLLLKQAGIKFTAVTYESLWGVNLVNAPDVGVAKNFCKKHNIEHEIVQLDFKNFLDSELYLEYALKYKTSSPQLAFHFYFLEQIDFENKSIIMGGDFPYFSWNEDDERIISYFNQDVSYLINNVVPYLEFSKQNNVKMCKDIFYSSPEIVYKTAEQGVALSKEHNTMTASNSRTQGNYGKELFYNSLLEEKLEPVLMSLTGFEMIKYHFASITGEYDHFNNTYRSKCMDMNSNFYKSTYGIPNSNDHDQKIFQFKVEGKHLVIDLIEDMDTYFKEHDFELLQHWDIEF